MRTMDACVHRERKKKRERRAESFWGQKEQESLFQLLPLVPDPKGFFSCQRWYLFRDKIGFAARIPSPQFLLIYLKFLYG